MSVHCLGWRSAIPSLTPLSIPFIVLSSGFCILSSSHGKYFPHRVRHRCLVSGGFPTYSASGCETVLVNFRRTFLDDKGGIDVGRRFGVGQLLDCDLSPVECDHDRWAGPLKPNEQYFFRGTSLLWPCSLAASCLSLYLPLPPCVLLWCGALSVSLQQPSFSLPYTPLLRFGRRRTNPKGPCHR